MASAVGDTAAAASYRGIREKGAKNIEELWNGDFYIQKVTPVGEISPCRHTTKKTGRNACTGWAA